MQTTIDGKPVLVVTVAADTPNMLYYMSRQTLRMGGILTIVNSDTETSVSPTTGGQGKTTITRQTSAITTTTASTLTTTRVAVPPSELAFCAGKPQGIACLFDHVFHDEERYIIDSDRSSVSALVAFDANFDGHIDLISASQLDNTIRFHRWIPATSSFGSVTVSASAPLVSDLAVGDWNGDVRVTYSVSLPSLTVN